MPPKREDAGKEKRVICWICGISIKESRVEKHIKKVHCKDGNTTVCSVNINKRIKQVNACLKEMKDKGLMKGDQISADPKQKAIMLISRRGSRISYEHTCDECFHHRAQWHYAESSIGEAYLCDRCKEIIFKRSFPRKYLDAMNLTRLGGGFESNRRRH